MSILPHQNENVTNITDDNVNSFTVLLLAGRRPGLDPICTLYNTRYKALAPVSGEPMILHTLRSLESCEHISEIIVLAQEPDVLRAELEGYTKSNKVRFCSSQGGIAKTVLMAWEQYNINLPLLITTADNCLLRDDHLNDFIFKSLNASSDLSIGFARKENVVSHYPETRRTWIKFQDTEVTGCNLFLLHSEKSRNAIKYWSEFDSSPKKFIKMAWSLGPTFFVRYLIRRITINETFELLSQEIHTKVSPVFMENPDVAIDADKETDIRQIEAILKINSKQVEDNKPSKPDKLPVVIFDLDRTITTFGTYTPVLVYYALRHNPLRLIFIPIIILLLIAYKIKFINRKKLKSVMFRLLMGSPRKEELDKACNAYVDTVLNKKVNLEALFTIRNWRTKGAQLVLATASFDWLADVFGRRLKFDQVVATKSIEQNGNIVAGIDGENCYGEDKLKMLSDIIGSLPEIQKSGRDIWFYTDHHSDIPILELCTHPVAVNASKKLDSWVANTPNARLLNWNNTIMGIFRQRFLEAISDTY